MMNLRCCHYYVILCHLLIYIIAVFWIVSLAIAREVKKCMFKGCWAEVFYTWGLVFWDTHDRLTEQEWEEPREGTLCKHSLFGQFTLCQGETSLLRLEGLWVDTLDLAWASANISRGNLRLQVDDLRQEKERLEAENAHLQGTLQAEVNRLCEENERLQEEKNTTATRGETQLEEERSETEK